MKTEVQATQRNFSLKRLRGEISLSDLIVAVEDLPWENEDQLRQVLQSLGYTLGKFAKAQDQKPTESAKGAYDHTYYDRKIRRRADQPHLPDTAPPAPELPIELSDQAISLDATLEPRESDEGQQIHPDWLGRGNLAGDFPPLFEDSNVPLPLPMARKSLFANNTSRSILVASLITQRIGNKVDIRRVINSIVWGEILQTLPKLTLATMEQGCQLLLDYSDSMAPYWDDLNALRKQIQNVAGIEYSRVYEFDSSPLSAKSRLSRKEKLPWEPETNKPVVVATDFGLSPGDQSLLTLLDWPVFLEKCASRCTPLVILTPLAKNNWPGDIGAYPVFIHWHPRTTASMVRQVIGNGHKVSA